MHVKKSVTPFPNAAEMEKSLSATILKTFQRLKKEDGKAFERAVELSGMENLTIEQKTELYKLVTFYGTASHEERQEIDKSIGGLAWNEGKQMSSLNEAMGKTMNNPGAYLLTTLSFVEHLNGDGIVAAFIINMLQKHVPLFVKDGRIAPLPDR